MTKHLSCPLVSVIVPVYNAGETLPTAINALKAQTCQDLELLFVNDCSTDNSLLLLQDFASALKKDKNIGIQVLSHETNRGVASARNTGLDHASGQFIYYVDADDWIAPDAIELMVGKAQACDADIVGVDWWLSFQKTERLMRQPAFDTSWTALENIMKGRMRWNLWLFLVKRSLYEDNAIRFEPGMNMGEDLAVMVKLFACAGKVVFLPKALYHYGQSSSSSLTKTYLEVHKKQVTSNVKEVERFLSRSVYADRLGDLIYYLKLNIKLPLLVSGKKQEYVYWLGWFPEAGPYVMDNTALPLRTRLLQWMALQKQFWFLELYHLLVIRVFYGVIYR